MSIYRNFWIFFQLVYSKRGVLDWTIITMPEAVPGHVCEFVQMSCINYLVWGQTPGNVFLAFSIARKFDDTSTNFVFPLAVHLGRRCRSLR